MRILITKKYEHWDVTADVFAEFKDGFLRVIQCGEGGYSLRTQEPAVIGDLFDLQVFGYSPTIVLNKIAK